MFFIAAALVLTTAGVVAAKAKFTTVPEVWAYNAAHTTPIEIVNASAITLDGLSTSQSGTQATITGALGTYGLYYQVSGNYFKLTATTF